MDQLMANLQIRILERGYTRHTVEDSTWHDAMAHRDPFSRLYWFAAGRGRLLLEGRMQTLGPGPSYLFPAHVPIRHIPSPGLEQYWIHFTAELPGGLSLFDVMEWQIEQKRTNRKQALQQMKTLVIASPTARVALEQQATLRWILTGFLGSPRLGWEERIQNLHRFEAVLRHVQEHLAEKIPLETLARLVSLHPNYFSNLFAERFGMSPRAYILQKRIEKAQTLLWFSRAPIKEIARQTGMEDVCYFCRMFRKHTGMTPTTYRKRRSYS